MQDNFTIVPIPVLSDKKCKFYALVLSIFLQFGIYIVMFLAVFYYGFVIGFFTTILAFIIIGIIRSKLRNSSIPLAQREYPYNDKAIATWFVSKEFCFGTD
ncbi:MAG: hypothetical protein WC144_05535 [Sulfurimonas sp.]|jgi:ABC-type multidrug transport system fused ATPase/permease subunit|nr:hypothetical protein [Sulfurimonadaceae bacterium]